MKKTDIPKDLITAVQVQGLLRSSSPNVAYTLRDAGLLRAYPTPDKAFNFGSARGRKPKFWYSCAEVLEYIRACQDEKSEKSITSMKPVGQVATAVHTEFSRKLKLLRRSRLCQRFLCQRLRRVDTSEKPTSFQPEVAPRNIRV